MKKLTKFRKISLALIGAITAGAAGLGIALPLVNGAHSTSQSPSNDNVNVETNVPNNSGNESVDVPSSELSTSTDSLNIMATGFNESTLNSSSTQSVKLSTTTHASTTAADSTAAASGEQELTLVDGSKKSFKVTDVYKNDRKFMPILAYDESISYYNYQQTRSSTDIMYGNFPGWDKTSTKLQSKTADLSKSVANFVTYTATDVLKKAFPSLEKTTIKQLYICMDDTLTKDVIRELLDQVKPDFLRITNINDSNFSQIPDISNEPLLKKLDLSGSYTSINGFKFPSILEELRINSPNITKIDPLQLPENASILYETSSDAKFTEIDLSGHPKLTTQDLQKAIDIVYTKRINERAFQGDFAGGYIYDWNLQNTGVTTFNDVNIPALDDGTGRFYIAYVSVSSDNTSDSANEVITEGTKPSNDSQINEWWDANGGWEKVTSVTVTAKSGAAIDAEKALTEILGFFNKYPNVTKFDISSLKFTDSSKNLEWLRTSLVEKLVATYGEDSPQAKVEFVVK